MRDVLARLRAEYLEMPGMRLTPGQVQRLCGVERTLCQCVLDALVTEQFLCLYSNGTYGRTSEGDVPRPRRTAYRPGRMTGGELEPILRGLVADQRPTGQ